VRKSLSVDRDVNAIRLRRTTFSGTFLLVEGSSDKVFYERFVDEAICELVSVSGKPSSKLRVIEVLRILESASFQGVLAIVDADFDHLKPSPNNSPNLLCTDTHDLETMILKSFALDKVLIEFGSKEKIINFNRDVRTALLEASMSVGYLRWASQLDELNLTFDGIIFSKFINEQTLQVDELKLVQTVKNKSQLFLLKDEKLQKRLISQKSSKHDPWQISCGHDFMEVLSLGLRKAIGSLKATDVEPNSLERSLRLAYEATYFCTTQLYSAIRTWESNNQPFQVLRN
jgi:hypothetical protein